jgi:hypothetical protein
MPRHRPNPRKLLVASIGVATLNYLPTACTGTVANLMASPDIGTGGGGPGPARDSGADAADARPTGTAIPPSPTVANLLAPAPPPQTQSSPVKKGR